MPKPKQDPVEHARDELHRAKQSLAALVAGEDDALASSHAYAEWQNAVASAKAEISRLTRLSIKAEADAKLRAEADARAAQERLEAEFDKAADTAAIKIAENLQRLADIARDTAALIAASEEQRLAAQAGRSKDRPPLVSAENRARGTGGLPTEVISETIVERWTFQETGHVLSADQAQRVRPMPNGVEGRLPSVGSMSTSGSKPVVKQAFTKRVFHPAVAAPPSHSIVASMLIPAATAGGHPGWAPCAEHPAAIRAALEALSSPIERKTKSELIPVSSAEEAAA